MIFVQLAARSLKLNDTLSTYIEEALLPPGCFVEGGKLFFNFDGVLVCSTHVCTCTFGSKNTCIRVCMQVISITRLATAWLFASEKILP